MVVGPEFEFYLFDSVRFESAPHHASFRVNSLEAEWNTGEEGRAYCPKRRFSGWSMICTSPVIERVGTAAKGSIQAAAICMTKQKGRFRGELCFSRFRRSRIFARAAVFR